MRRALLLLPLVMGAAHAQEMRWGLQALGSTTSADLAMATDDATGFGVGLHLFISDAGANALRFRLEGQTFPGKSRAGVKTRVSEADLTADWLYFFSGRTETGPYSMLSAGVVHWRTEVDDPVVVIPSENKTSALLSGGVGWQLGRTFGVEAQAWWSDRFRKDQGRATGLTAMLTIRF